MTALLFCFLFTPSAVRTPMGLTVEHCGHQFQLARIDVAFFKAAEAYKDTPWSWVGGITPRFTRVSIQPVYVNTDCIRQVRWAVTDGPDALTYQVTVSPELLDSLDSVLETAFSYQLRMLTSGVGSVMKLSEGCVN